MPFVTSTVTTGPYACVVHAISPVETGLNTERDRPVGRSLCRLPIPLLHMASHMSVFAAGQQIEVMLELTHLYAERDAELSFQADARLIYIDECA